MRRRVMAIFAGSGSALLPILVSAQEHGGGAVDVADRSLETGNLGAMTWTLAAVGGLFLVAAIGYLYRRQNNLDWAFQRPEPPHDDHDVHGHDASHDADASHGAQAAPAGGGHH